MNTTVITLLVGSILGLVFFLMLHMYNLKKGKAVKGQKLKAKKLIARGKIIIDKKDIINNQLIGLDRSKKILVLSDLEDNEEELTTIPLSKVAYWKLYKQSREVVHRGRNRTVSEMLLNKISLLFFSAKKNLLFEFVFFDQEKNGFNELPYLINRAEYWKKLIKKTGAVEIA